MRCSPQTASTALVAAAAVLGLTLLAGAYSADFGPWAESASPFAHHPALMGLAFGTLMPLGMAAYALELPCPARVRKALADRHTRRKMHAALSAAAFLACAGGMYLGWAAREVKGKSHLPWGKAFLKQVHIWGGYATVAAVAVQAGSGVAKYVSRVRHNVRVAPLHGRLGPAIWLGGCVCVATGAQFSFLAKGYTLTGSLTLLALAAGVPSALALLYALPRPYLTDAVAAAHARQSAAAGDAAPPGSGADVEATAAPRAGREGGAGATPSAPPEDDAVEGAVLLPSTRS
jgi:hypothetical protein